MNETETHETITTTVTPIAETPPLMSEPPITETVTPGHPDRYARNDPGSFAAGEETTPDKDAEERVHARGSFASGEEQTPEKDAEERVHPGTFGDTEPTA